MNKEIYYNVSHITTFMVVYVTDREIHAAFMEGNRVYFDSWSLVDDGTPYKIYQQLTDKMGENLVSEVIIVDYVEGFQISNIKQLTGIGKAQMIVELASVEMQIPYQVISFADAMRYTNPIDNSFTSEEHIETKMSEYYKKFNEISKHKSVELYKLSDIDTLKTIDLLAKGTYMGIVYVLKYGHMVKIGSSKQPYNRFMTLKRQAEKYGNIKVSDMAISGLHTNFRENEKIAHRQFLKFRREGTELFDIDFETAKNYLNTLSLLDESERMNESAEVFRKEMGNFIFGSNPSHLKNQNK